MKPIKIVVLFVIEKCLLKLSLTFPRLALVAGCVAETVNQDKYFAYIKVSFYHVTGNGARRVLAVVVLVVNAPEICSMLVCVSFLLLMSCQLGLVCCQRKSLS